MKRISVLILALLMLVSSFVLTGCDDDDTKKRTRRYTTTETTVTTAVSNDITTTTKRPEPITNPDMRTEGVINEKITKTIYSYDVYYDYSVGDRQAREITYKGTIKIGNTAASTGAFATAGGPFNEGLKAYINRINYYGGLGGDYNSGKKGYYVEFVHYDDGFQPDVGAAYTKKLVEEDKVFALVGHFGTPTVFTTVEYIKQQGVIACYFASGYGSLFNAEADSVKNGSTIFPVQPIYTTEGMIIVARILEQYPDAKKIGVVYTNDEIGEGLKDGAKAQIERLGADYECVASEVSTDATDFTPAVAKIKDCDVVIVAAIQKDAVSIIKAMIANGIYKPCFTTYSNASSQLLLEIKPYYDGLSDDAKAQLPIYTNAWLSSTDLEDFAEFGTDIIACTGENTLSLNSYAMAGWIAANVFCEGVERVLDSGKPLNNLTYVEAMESAPIRIKLGTYTIGSGERIDSTLDYSDGIRIGTTTMALLKSDDECTTFETAADAKNFIRELYAR